MSFETTPIYSAIEIKEAGDASFIRETGQNPRVEWKFLVRGAEDASTAYAALVTWLFENYADSDGSIASYNIPLHTIRFSATGSNFVYEADCTFEYKTDDSNSINDVDYQSPDIEDKDFQYSTSGGTQHITHSYGTVAIPAVGETVRDFGHGIGWNGESFDGIDVECPHSEFSVSVSLPKTFVTTAYRVAMANMTGAINSVAWGGFDAYCVQFKNFVAKPQKFSYTGPNGEERFDWYWRAEYQFEARAPETIVFGGVSTVKPGFDYLWRVEEKTVGSDGGATSETVQINIERVYRSFDFRYLNIPFPS